ncbi:hypothetical protein KO488_08300 [Poseidonibacter lekithochrous]|uniref:hypothetical protein n=1 Tax=Poseidonibacter TaxID=2321187 RepID=UPI001C08C39F|nr:MULTISPECIES: hypothetical protein [Poseidonibacter]MBU3014755.1 hypothetical protein [Poseidonibacter lekithochrous]MDO6828053.1 hypothetical protein [Poseidonibacter sp. 1_MG-2023]
MNENIFDASALATTDKDINPLAILGGIAMLDAFKQINTIKNKNDKFLKSAYVRKKRYKNRCVVYSNRLNTVRDNLNIFTSSYDVFLFTKLNDSEMYLYMALDFIDCYKE